MIEHVKFTPSADRQFLSLLEYIKADNPAAARDLRKRVGDSFDNVCTFPAIGRVVPEFPDLGFREIIIRPYRFFYDVIGDTVWVIGAWHSAQIPKESPSVSD